MENQSSQGGNIYVAPDNTVDPTDQEGGM